MAADPHEPPVPTWVAWTNRAVLTLAGTTAAVMVADYARVSRQALDVALVAAIIAATVVAVLRPDRAVPVTVAALLAMLGLAIIPPAWLLALVPPTLLAVTRRRQRRQRSLDDTYGPGGPPRDPDEDPTP